MELISIILPYYRKRQFIKKTIFSVINQTYKKIELLIIFDDENKDDLKYLKDISKIDKRIRIIVNKKNIGAGLSRNKGIKYCKGKFIAFIDADDLWKRNKLKKQLNFMKINNYDITHTSYEIIDSNEKIIGIRKAYDLTLQNLLLSCDIGLSTVMLKKNILKKNLFVNLKTKEDYVLWLNLAKKNYKFYAIKNSLTFWRSLKNSLSSSVIQKLKDGFRVYRYYLKQSLFRSLISLMILSINYIKK
tara:strand:- start:198 stop:932 length:735 start_codon:yes stop_codon:yes gene_type:complete